MATTNRVAEHDDAPSDVIAAIRDAELVHLVAVADGDCLAAAGLLARACTSSAIPYHVGIVRTAADLDARLAGVDASATPIAVGTRRPDVVGIRPDGAVSASAVEVAAGLDARPDPVTALAGIIAAGEVPSRVAPELLDTAGLDRAPGVAVPTTDLADGLAHTGLFHADFSGDVTAAREALASVGVVDGNTNTLDADGARHVASLVALGAAGAPTASSRAATAVEWALRPYLTDGPFETLAGHADVLVSLAEREPGLAVAMAVGANGREAALDAWRDHGRAAHAAVRGAETARYHGVLVARTDGPVAAVARLLCQYRSPEPVVLAVGDGEAAAVGAGTDVAAPLAAAAEAGQGSALAGRHRGYATFDADRTERVVDAFREGR